MSYEAHLIHTCTIENVIEDGLDAHHNKVFAWDTPVENVPCRLVEKRERGWKDERTASSVETTYQLLLLADTPLLERGRVSAIVLEDGSVLDQKFTVREFLARRGRVLLHKTALLEQVK